ncbi:spore germination protein GerPC [Bacillus pumilus]|uniref:spore germination protein GerPC n=1 Tax=Bacillus pumilus TaxID=1408 RepID=UPI0028CB6D43|nr:spore germination protein GerPC [Bacillus pumilus]
MKHFILSLFKKTESSPSPSVTELEKRLTALEQKMSELASPVSEDTHIHIESLHVDKIDYHLEFGELSIDQLQGRLNIGATYYTPKDTHIKKSAPPPKPKETKTPAVSIRSKPPS